MKFFIVVFFTSLAPFAVSAHGLSAHRSSNETYQDAYQRVHGDRIEDADNQDDEAQIEKATSPDHVKKNMNSLNLKEIPDVGSLADLMTQFQYVRDTRFLQTDDPNFPRRLTWLFPDDGCYARAEMASQELIAHNFTAPKKIFVFGNLSADTTNAPGGSVQWWYHVAVIYRVGDTPYVVDPALNPKAPMTLVQWNKAVGGEKTNVQYSICSKDTFDPDADCYKPTPTDAAQAESEQKGFLQDEWDRLLELNRNPSKELGDSPPWLNN
ncbi:MAG TPA: protein-glutamine glutaminase family protein [Bdellovibrio sp.]|uniref:protein-glutamine glutaminase family protein n=1 Tax=Bdellovibrio sp. TaxID=28201 RepID=UPI002F1C7542